MKSKKIDELYIKLNSIVESPFKFKKYFNSFKELLISCPEIEIYKNYNDLIQDYSRKDYVFDSLLYSLKNNSKNCIPLSHGDTEYPCFIFKDETYCYYDMDDLIENIRKIIIKYKYIKFFFDNYVRSDAFGFTEDYILKFFNGL